MTYIIALISILLGSIAQFFLKKGMSHVNLSEEILVIFKKIIFNGYIINGITCYILSLLFWLYVLSKLELSKAYPMVSLGYVFTTILGYLLLNESITINKIIGISFIIIGVYFITD